MIPLLTREDYLDGGWPEAFAFLQTQEDHLATGARPSILLWPDVALHARDALSHPVAGDSPDRARTLAAKVLTAEGEEDALAWLVAHAGTRAPADGWEDADVGMLAALSNLSLGEAHAVVANLTEQHLAEAAEWAASNGWMPRYLGVDMRLFPFQNKPLAFHELAHIANKHPEEFMQVTLQGGGLRLEMQQYGINADDQVFLYAEPKFVDSEGQEWEVVGFRAYPLGQNLTGQGILVHTKLDVQERFLDTMYARMYGGLSASRPAGDTLTHWRTIHQSIKGDLERGLRQVVILEYAPGHRVTGTVTHVGGLPAEDVHVTTVDGFGASHGGGATDANGTFSIRAPFSVGGDLDLVVRQGSEAIHVEPLNVTRAQARGGGSTNVTLELQPGRVTGLVYWDVDDDGGFQPGIDRPLEDALVSLERHESMTATGGRFDLGEQPAMAGSLRVQREGFVPVSEPVTVAGHPLDVEVGLKPLYSSVEFTFVQHGERVENPQIWIEGSTQVTPRWADSNGTITLELPPGDYVVQADGSYRCCPREIQPYQASLAFTIPVGGEPAELVVDGSE